jgi:hypothetical protein
MIDRAGTPAYAAGIIDDLLVDLCATGIVLVDPHTAHERTVPFEHLISSLTEYLLEMADETPAMWDDACDEQARIVERIRAMADAIASCSLGRRPQEHPDGVS